MGGELFFCRFRTLLSLVLFTLLLCQVPWGRAAPAMQHQDSTVLSKIYPRGSHWAVGHMMGKKSTEEIPYGYEAGDRAPFSDIPETRKPLAAYLQWEETLKNLLRLLEGAENQRGQSAREEELPSNNRKSWESEDQSLKEMLDYLVQVVNMKENTSS